MQISMRDSDNWTQRGFYRFSSAGQVPAADWTFVGFSVEAHVNAVDSTVRAWTNENAGETANLNGYVYVN
jgi:hypothetical protein